MTDDDREGFEPVAPDDAGDPAAAFEALRRTVEKQGGQIGVTTRKCWICPTFENVW